MTLEDCTALPILLPLPTASESNRVNRDLDPTQHYPVAYDTEGL